MAQFIHLLLLLGMCHVAATGHNERQVWLLEGSSATFPFPSLRTIKYCGRGGSKCECVSGKCKSNNPSLPGITVTDSTLTITNFTRENDEINLCYDSSPSSPPGRCVHLNVSIGCSESHEIMFAEGQPTHKVTTVADCRRLCTEDPTCQYFTFYKPNKNCFLMTSRDYMLIQFHSNTVSGYPARDDCAPSDAASSASPSHTQTASGEIRSHSPIPSTSAQPASEETAPVNPTSVPPGPTPPQASVEKEEEEGPKCQQMVFWS
ncbi:hypothetical protein ABVT39_004931 [Epinephelus coioides]